MRRHPLSPQQKLGALASLALGLVVLALGTVGPWSNMWIDGMIPVSVAGGVLTLAAIALLVFGPARPALSA